MTKAFDKISV